MGMKKDRMSSETLDFKEEEAPLLLFSIYKQTNFINCVLIFIYLFNLLLYQLEVEREGNLLALCLQVFFSFPRQRRPCDILSVVRALLSKKGPNVTILS